jgi:hypothetical protein
LVPWIGGLVLAVSERRRDGSGSKSEMGLWSELAGEHGVGGYKVKPAIRSDGGVWVWQICGEARIEGVGMARARVELVLGFDLHLQVIGDCDGLWKLIELAGALVVEMVR